MWIKYIWNNIVKISDNSDDCCKIRNKIIIIIRRRKMSADAVHNQVPLEMKYEF